MNVLAVNAVDVPGEPELRLLDALQRLRDHGWEPTISTPGERPPPGADLPWLHLDVGGLEQGEGARAVASWPRALRLAQRFDVVYLNSTVCGRLLPALRGTYAVLHVHVLVDRDDGAARGAQLGREGAVARAEVEHAVAGAHVREQERAARREPLGPRARGNGSPDRLAPWLHGWQRCQMPPLTTLPGA